MKRYLNPFDIYVEPDFSISVFASELNSPGSILITDNNKMYITDTGELTGEPKLLLYENGKFESIAEGFNTPITGITYRFGKIFVSHRGSITIVDENGTQKNIVQGLPCQGDFPNSNVTFRSDNRLFFGIGTATNSGVVGLDNKWVINHPYFHDKPGDNIIVFGQNFESYNYINHSKEPVLTGAFSSFGEMNFPYEQKKGTLLASGSILSCNPDGTDIQLYAWGFRNISSLNFGYYDRLFACNNGYDERGSRPIANASDDFYHVEPGVWYGWPDFSAGMPVTSPKFDTIYNQKIELLISNPPNIPPRPITTFPNGTNLKGFLVNEYREFGNIGDIFITEYGGTTIKQQYYGRKISKINTISGETTTFAMNKSGNSLYSTTGGFGRPSDLAFDTEGDLYVIDSGINNLNNSHCLLSNTGVIWKISRER